MTRRLATFVLALGLAGCGPTGVPSKAPFEPTAVAALAHLNVSSVRRWTDFYGTDPITVTEHSLQAGDGSWSVELLTLNGKAASELKTADELKAFAKLSRTLESGRGRYTVSGRDFRIREWNAFQANYGWSLISTTEVVAGRPVYVADVWSKTHDRPRYTVWVDQQTLLTMKCLEYLPSGDLASEMEVLSIDWNPNLDGVELKPAPENLAVDAQTFASLVSFQTFNVAYVPAGFYLVHSKLATIVGQPVLTQSYSDGLVELLFAQYADPQPEPLPEGVAPDEPISVHTTYWGSFAQSVFVLSGTQVHIQGKLANDELMNVIESITPNP